MECSQEVMTYEGPSLHPPFLAKLAPRSGRVHWTNMLGRLSTQPDTTFAKYATKWSMNAEITLQQKYLLRTFTFCWSSNACWCAPKSNCHVCIKTAQLPMDRDAWEERHISLADIADVYINSRSWQAPAQRVGSRVIMARPPLPPFTLETAQLKVQAAEDAWNSKDPDKVSLAYSEHCQWRNRAEFISGRNAIRQFLKRKWERELDYHLRKYLWAYTENRISVCFEYEYHDASGQWFRAYGNENWEFDKQGLMRKRVASINESPISEQDRRIAVEEGANPPRNDWLAEQGLALGEFPLGDGHQPCY